MKYLVNRHKKLMEASEFALRDAVDSPIEDRARIANTVLHDPRTYRRWESAHAELLYPVAQQRNDTRMLGELRMAQLQLVHRRALFQYLKDNEITGHKRAQMLRLFHSTLDFDDAVLVEHRRYMLAVSSRISAKHITVFMNDAESDRLLHLYERAYARYFEAKCCLAMSRSRAYRAMVRPILAEAQGRVLRIRERLRSETPSTSGYRFEVQEALSRSGRYKALNYLNA